MLTQRQLDAAARRLVRLLEQNGRRIVFAESCTGGLVSATLTRIPGVSEFHCGSAVVYQVATKAHWLHISPEMLKDPGPVSREVARALAEGVLSMTPQADLSAAVTGYLGPHAPPGQDGLVFVAVAVRRPASADVEVSVEKHRLPGDSDRPASRPSGSTRLARQKKAAQIVLESVCARLE